MEGHHHQQHHQQHQQHQQQQQQHHSMSSSMEQGDSRVPQWSFQETKEFLAIRAELDQTFMETKRNKLLWEVISNKMKEKGYLRSSDQCKCKWKNLVTRYKGCETIEPESMRQQFPFYNELQTIFSARMQRMLWLEAEGGPSSSGVRKKGSRLSSDDDDYNEESDEEKVVVKKKMRKGKGASTTGTSSGNTDASNLQHILEEFMRQQVQMEAQWRESVELREKERRMREMEWRQRMEELEKERLLMDRSWREREEQRRMREEARAEKRDALITALLNKLRREDM
ncbi:hypothetical protein MKW94_030243 [Papaver nudicaule]|uniref:Myb-like domain-containing protein n=1 Tax=Papaver nudicaule TaxID=74823 RepID=A0AA41SC26_PAPNU|nr:hypothetical protein [Papaver nudicaule]